MNMGVLKLPMLAILAALLLVKCGSDSGLASGGVPGPAQVSGDSVFGTSGGNVNDFGPKHCCSGTLGALVEDNPGNRYVLSNNHVLARTNRANVGERINHPGLIDQNCGRSGVIAELSIFEPLLLGDRSNPGAPNFIDAAVAVVTESGVAADPSIEGIGAISSNTVGAFAGQLVQKTGRTTGLTFGTVSAVGVTILVGYSAECGEAASRYGVFSNQIIITPGSFSNGGDSGSLIVERNVGSDPPRAVGLLFARTSNATLANPIDSILSTFNLAMVGVSSNAPSLAAQFPELLNATEDEATAATASSEEEISPATVVSVTYTTTGNEQGNHDLHVTVRVVDRFGRPVHNAHLGIVIDKDDSLYGTGAGAVTNTEGEATYTLSDARDGLYIATIAYLEADGLSFAGPESTPYNAYINGSDPSPMEFHVFDGVAEPAASSVSTPITIQDAVAAKSRHSGAIMSLAGVVGHGVSISEPGYPQIEVYLESYDAETQFRLPASIDGVPCHTVITGLFLAE